MFVCQRFQIAWQYDDKQSQEKSLKILLHIYFYKTTLNMCGTLTNMLSHGVQSDSALCGLHFDLLVVESLLNQPKSIKSSLMVLQQFPSKDQPYKINLV